MFKKITYSINSVGENTAEFKTTALLHDHQLTPQAISKNIHATPHRGGSCYTKPSPQKTR